MEHARDLIIVVDDDITNLTVARHSLAELYDVFVAPSGEKLFTLLKKVTPSIILLDVEMPEMNGYQVLEALKEREKTAHIPVIFLTAKIDPESEIKGLSLGAADYMTKPFSRDLLIKRIDLHILFEKQRKELLKYNLSLESEVDKKAKTVIELQNAILRTVAELVECRDDVTGSHIERTQHYLRMLVDYLIEHDVYADELSSWDIDLLIMSSQLHDVGKISIKDGILLKPGKLTYEEFEEMKKHTTYGVEIIRKIERNTSESEFLQYAEILAGSHHEKWSGKGYPYGLTEEKIPLQGRLMAVIDVYDALTNARPYKKAFTHKEAIKIIKDGLGTHFDPRIGEIFLTHEKDFEINKTPRKEYKSPNKKLSMTVNAVTNIIGIHGGREQDRVERLKRLLEIFIGAMLKHDGYRDEVASWDTELFLISAQLHDVGKIAVKDNILSKADKLTNDEYEIVKTHVDFGSEVIRRIKDNIANGSLLHHAEAVAGSHHERWDGTGYPHGLKEEDIPLQGRIMAIVDVYDALTTDRPHRVRKTHKEAVEIIMYGRGTHFDPGLVDVFLEYEKEFEESGAMITPEENYNG